MVMNEILLLCHLSYFRIINELEIFSQGLYFLSKCLETSSDEGFLKRFKNKFVVYLLNRPKIISLYRKSQEVSVLNFEGLKGPSKQ